MIHVREVSQVKFPLRENININMMPFIMGDARSIPWEYRHYYPMIEACRVHESQLGKVGYLSIQENHVEHNTSQRRAGIHTEGFINAGWGGGGWGGGNEKPKVGGLYQGSTVANSCRVWETRVDCPGTLGNCEHLRSTLGSGFLMKPDTLYWMHDRVPHESLPLKFRTYRQWFRLVTSAVDNWYAANSTPNRLGIVAPCNIIHKSKFAGA